MNSTTSDISQPLERLVYTQDEVCRVGGFKKTTAWRLEKRGLLKRVPGVITPLYTIASVRDFFAGKAVTK